MNLPLGVPSLLPFTLMWRPPFLLSKTRRLQPAPAPRHPRSHPLVTLLPLVPPFLPSLPASSLPVVPSPWIWMVFGVTRVHSPWRSVVVVLTAVSVPTVGSLVMLWPRARLRLVHARLGVLINTSLSSPHLILRLLLPQPLLPLLPLHLLQVIRPVTLQLGTFPSGTLQRVSHLQFSPIQPFWGHSLVPGPLFLPLPSPLPLTRPLTPLCQKTAIPASRGQAGRHPSSTYSLPLPHSLSPYLAGPHPRPRPAAYSHSGAGRLGCV